MIVWVRVVPRRTFVRSFDMAFCESRLHWSTRGCRSNDQQHMFTLDRLRRRKRRMIRRPMRMKGIIGSEDLSPGLDNAFSSSLYVSPPTTAFSSSSPSFTSSCSSSSSGSSTSSSSKSASLKQMNREVSSSSQVRPSGIISVINITTGKNNFPLNTKGFYC